MSSTFPGKHPAKTLVLGALIAVLCSGATAPGIDVVYAGSLVRAMEQRVGPDFSRHCRCPFRGEAKGSQALANLIISGLRTPDVFISADTSILDGLLHPSGHAAYIKPYVVFGAARMVLGYARTPAVAAQIARVRSGRESIAQLLQTPGLRIGRTDPRVDPKGYRALLVAQLLHASAALGDPENAAQVYPEETLLTRLESTDLDVAFLYSTEVHAGAFGVLELPAEANLGHPALVRQYARARVVIGGSTHIGAPITYAVAQLNGAPHPALAADFVRFIRNGGGQRDLRESGLLPLK